MEALTCGICLDQLKVPVSTPCGHLCCEACLTSYIEAGADALNASCPTCRAPFSIAIPDLRFVPKKYHSLIIPSIRRVFISPNPVADASADAESTRDLRAQVARLTDKIDGLVRDKTLLMDRCEAALRASQAHAQGERDERLAKERFERDLRDLRKKYEAVKGKYKALKTLHDNVPASAAPTHMKRTSSQAALDNTSFSASSSTDSLDLPPVPELPTGRPILRIPKRPRLLGSPFDLSKRIESRHAPARLRGRRVTDSDDDEFEDADAEEGHGRSGGALRASDLSSSAGSSSGSSMSMGASTGPQRSGLPAGDIFSPRRREEERGRQVFGYAAGRRVTVSTGFNPGWLLSPEDA